MAEVTQLVTQHQPDQPVAGWCHGSGCSRGKGVAPLPRRAPHGFVGHDHAIPAVTADLADPLDDPASPPLNRLIQRRAAAGWQSQDRRLAAVSNVSDTRPLASGYVRVEIEVGRVEVRRCRSMDLTHRGMHGANARYRRRSLSAALAAVIVVVIAASVVACGNKESVKHPTPTQVNITSNSEVVGGDSLAPPSAPAAGQSGPGQPGLAGSDEPGFSGPATASGPPVPSQTPRPSVTAVNPAPPSELAP